jgi:hypothetical protein
LDHIDDGVGCAGEFVGLFRWTHRIWSGQASGTDGWRRYIRGAQAQSFAE